jgi:hypothetical protein
MTTAAAFTADTIWPSLSRTGVIGVELMLVALQLSSGEALVALILIIALLIWAFS